MKRKFLLACMFAALTLASCGGGAGNQQNQNGTSTGESAYDTTDSATVDSLNTTDTSGRGAGGQGQPGN